MREIKGLDLSMLSDDYRKDGTNARELADGIVNDFEQQRADMGIDVILQSEALMFEKKIDSTDAHWAFEQVLSSMGPEMESYFKSFHQSLRKSQVTWSKLLGSEANLARELQQQPDSVLRLKNFREAENNGFSRVLYVPSQFQNIPIKDLSERMSNEYGILVDGPSESVAYSEPRPNQIYPLVFSTSLNGSDGYLKERFQSADHVLKELKNRQDRLPQQSELQISGLTTREYMLFQSYAYAIKGFFRDLSRDKKEYCLLLDSNFKKLSRIIGFGGGGVYKDQISTLRLVSRIHFPQNASCRFAVRMKNE